MVQQLDFILHDCMYIPDICINLFSITKALSEGWKLSNNGLQLILSRSNQNNEFDQIMKTAHGYVCGVTMLPFCDPGGAVMKLALRYLCPSPIGGESTSNFFSDNAHNCSKYKCIKLVYVTFDPIVQFNHTILQIKHPSMLQTNMYLTIQFHQVLMKIHESQCISNNATKYNVQISISKIKQQNDFFEVQV